MVRVLVRSSFTCLVIFNIKGSKKTACKAKINHLQYIAFIVFSINNAILKVHTSSKKAGVWFRTSRSHWFGEFTPQWISRRSSYLQHRNHYWKGNFYMLPSRCLTYHSISLSMTHNIWKGKELQRRQNINGSKSIVSQPWALQYLIIRHNDLHTGCAK